jgi:hypothetical protein
MRPSGLFFLPIFFGGPMGGLQLFSRKRRARRLCAMCGPGGKMDGGREKMDDAP